jgi:hypothetical protein
VRSLRSTSESGVERGTRHRVRGLHSRQAKRQRYGHLFGRIENGRTDVDLTVIGKVNGIEIYRMFIASVVFLDDSHKINFYHACGTS